MHPAAPAQRTPFTFASLHFWCCSLVIWTYFASVQIYKLWYIAAAIALLIGGYSALTGRLSIRGIGSNLLLLSSYFGYLWITSFWAIRPDLTEQWLTYDTIEIGVFILFYTLALNVPLVRLVDFGIAMMLPALVVTLVMSYIDSESIRLGGRSPAIIPAFLPFALVKAKLSRWERGPLALAIGLGVLVISMSRAPLLGGLIAVALTVLMLSGSVTQLVRSGAAMCGVAVIGVLCLLAVESTRVLVVKSLVRITGQQMMVAGVMIQPEMEDLERSAIYEEGAALLEQNMPWGLGYMNFPHYFERIYHYPMSLHNTYQAWAVETGVPGVSIVALLLGRYFWILRRRLRAATSLEERYTLKALGIAMISVMVMALHHQMHQVPTLFMLLGMVYAVHVKSARAVVRHAPPRPAFVRGAGLSVRPLSSAR